MQRGKDSKNFPRGQISAGQKRRRPEPPKRHIHKRVPSRSPDGRTDAHHLCGRPYTVRSCVPETDSVHRQPSQVQYSTLSSFRSHSRKACNASARIISSEGTVRRDGASGIWS